LRREQYQGSIVMLSNDDAPPVDRPNLSKDYLAGNAPEDWIPLRSESFYSDNNIELHLDASVIGIDTRSREVALAEGSKIRFDRLLLATGADPIRLSIPGADLPHVCTLRSLADCRAIIARAKTAHRARGRGRAARPWHRGPCGGTGEATDGAYPRPADR
jgi:apoptosis-inducing factor 3